MMAHDSIASLIMPIFPTEEYLIWEAEHSYEDIEEQAMQWGEDNKEELEPIYASELTRALGCGEPLFGFMDFCKSAYAIYRRNIEGKG